MDEQLGHDRDGPGVWLAVTSISFDISVLELFWTLTRGFTVVLQEDESRLADAAPRRRAAPARPMDFSLFYFAADAAERPADRYRLLLEGAKFADQHGFAAVWTPERHFHAFGGLYPNPAVTSAAVAAVTERIEIRAGSVVLPLHNPIRVRRGLVGRRQPVERPRRALVRLGLARQRLRARAGELRRPPRADGRGHRDGAGAVARRVGAGHAAATGATIEVTMFPPPVQHEPPIWITAGGSPNVRDGRPDGRQRAHEPAGESHDELVAEHRRLPRGVPRRPAIPATVTSR